MIRCAKNAKSAFLDGNRSFFATIVMFRICYLSTLMAITVSKTYVFYGNAHIYMFEIYEHSLRARLKKYSNCGCVNYTICRHMWYLVPWDHVHAVTHLLRANMVTHV